MSQRGKIALVMLFFSVCGTAALTSHFLARKARPPTPAALYTIIYRQFQALQHDDFSTAYQQVSLEVQRKFTLAQFTGLVRQEYGHLVQARRIEFGRIELHENRAFIEVFFIEERGAVQPCIFQLGNDSGAWKIEGARLLPRWPAGRVLDGVQA